MRNKLIALLLMTTISLSMIGQEADDYKPFVETIDQWTHYPDLVKEWNVIQLIIPIWSKSGTLSIHSQVRILISQNTFHGCRMIILSTVTS